MRNISEKRKRVETKYSKPLSNKWSWRRVHVWWFNFILRSLNFLLTVSFLKWFGVRCALNLKVEEVEFVFCNLPRNFDGVRILLITDFHVGALKGLCEGVLAKAHENNYDYCILGGDYIFGWREEDAEAYRKISEIGSELCKKSRVFGILGNHDLYSAGETLERCGVEMLVNENVCVEKNGEGLYLCGVDDYHYYKADDLALACEGIGDGEFKIILSHSPCRYKEASKRGYTLYLAGHTHGGQICLPGGFALATNTVAKREMIKGKWEYEGMEGYTSRGVGVTGLGVRFFCEPEMTIVTLRRG